MTYFTENTIPTQALRNKIVRKFLCQGCRSYFYDPFDSTRKHCTVCAPRKWKPKIVKGEQS